MAHFPSVRPRRLRENPAIRDLVRETHVHPSNLVMPLFVRPGKKERRPIAAMPGIAQLSPDEALRECETLAKAGVRAALLFGIPEGKDASASWGHREDGVVQQTLRLVKKELPDLLLVADVCLCDYTDMATAASCGRREIFRASTTTPPWRC